MQKRPAGKQRRRPPVPADVIVTDLRARIVSGELKPGDRLPTRSECELRYTAASMTIQRAFTRLARDGFITAKGRHGTFVAERPPHIHRFVLAIPVSRNSAEMLKFWIRLREAAEQIEASGRAHIDVYHGISPGSRDPDLGRLEADIATGRLAGIVFANNPWPLKGNPILTRPGIPRIGFMGSAGSAEVARIAMGSGEQNNDFFKMAVQHLAERGRKRIAMLIVPGIAGDLRPFRNALASQGLPFHERWVQVASQRDAVWMANQVLLLMSPPLGERPDGIIIADDHLVDPACNGLAKLGLETGPDLDVVAHANFPLDRPATLPITRLGFDIPEALITAIGVLERKRCGETVPDVTVLQARFEEPPARDAMI